MSDEKPFDIQPTNPEVRVVDKRKLGADAVEGDAVPVAEAPAAEAPST